MPSILSITRKLNKTLSGLRSLRSFFGSFRAAGLLSVLVPLVPLLCPGVSFSQDHRPLFKTAAVGASGPDTLEVFVIYVQFDSEGNQVGGPEDDPGTTGLGTFGSDSSTSYTLDPGANLPALRLDTSYLAKHFEFAENYFNKASNGAVVIVPRYFPPPDPETGEIKPIQLSQHMKAYNPALQDETQKQKIADFATIQAQALMTFVSETAARADSQAPASNPFQVAFSEPKSPNRYQAFLLFHAGSSRLIDGGSLGPAGANTPNDLLDFFVTKSDFQNLATADNAKGGPSPYRVDSLGMVVDSTRDTVTQFMMMPEGR